MTTTRRVSLRRMGLLAIGILGLAAVGCHPKADESSQAPAKPALAGMDLELVVVDDPALAGAVRQLQGEWNLQSGSKLTVRQATGAEFAAGGAKADVAIVAEGDLGALVEGKKVIPIPPELLQSSEAGWNGVFDLVRTRVVQWGKEVYAAPLGSPQLVCYYRADLLRAIDREPPATWDEYQEIAELLADRKKSGDPAAAAMPAAAVAEPLGPGWGGLTLLARAAAYAKHRENVSTLFDFRTMEPLVATAPFVRALEELVAAAKLGADESLQADPEAVRERFWRGQCALALTWPSAASKSAAELPAGMVPEMAPLPGSTEVFRSQDGTWGTRGRSEPKSVPLIGLAGRLGVVAEGSAHPEAAARFLLWLSSDARSAEVARVSPATTLFRRVHVEQANQWVETPMPSPMASRYGELTLEACQTEQWFDAPRIPGRAEYLAALDAAVRRAVLGEQSPADSLTAAAAEWQAITEKLGRDAQREAYSRSLGLAP